MRIRYANPSISVGVNDGLIKKTRRDVPMGRTTAPGLVGVQLSSSLSLLPLSGLELLPSSFCITKASRRADWGMEYADAGAPVIACSRSFVILDRADGESLGLIFLDALRQARKDGDDMFVAVVSVEVLLLFL